MIKIKNPFKGWDAHSKLTFAFYILFVITLVVAILISFRSANYRKDSEKYKSLYDADQEIISDLNSREYQKTAERNYCNKVLSYYQGYVNNVLNSVVILYDDAFNHGYCDESSKCKNLVYWFDYAQADYLSSLQDSVANARSINN